VRGTVQSLDELPLPILHHVGSVSSTLERGLRTRRVEELSCLARAGLTVALSVRLERRSGWRFLNRSQRLKCSRRFGLDRYTSALTSIGEWQSPGSLGGKRSRASIRRRSGGSLGRWGEVRASSGWSCRPVKTFSAGVKNRDRHDAALRNRAEAHRVADYEIAERRFAVFVDVAARVDCIDRGSDGHARCADSRDGL